MPRVFSTIIFDVGHEVHEHIAPVVLHQQCQTPKWSLSPAIYFLAKVAVVVQSAQQVLPTS